MGVTFTVAIPTHDRRETALMAVRSVLAQTRPVAEVLVLCDGCTDGTADAVRALGDPRVEALELEKAPGFGYGHRNTPLERAAGEAIVYLADDDLLLPDHVERIGELWDSGRYDLVQNPAVRVDPDDTLTWMGADWSVPALRARFEADNSHPMASISVRVERALAAGGWDGTVPRGGDWDLWRRMLAAGARSGTTIEPTHLHFRATHREQPWPDRVRQNGDWLARIGDPAQLAALRAQLRRTRDVRDAERLDRFDALAARTDEFEQRMTGAEEYGDRLHAELERVREQLAAVAAERDGARAETVTARADADAAHAQMLRHDERAHAAEQESVRLGTTLAQIEAGGWWRLRARLLPLLRLARRSR